MAAEGRSSPSPGHDKHFLIRCSSEADAANDDLVSDLVAIINEVYAVGEKGLFTDDPFIRIEAAELRTLMKSEKILLMFGAHEYVTSIAAIEGSNSSLSNGCEEESERWVIVGCIKMDYDKASLGMLAIRTEMQGRGCAAKLMSAVEVFLREKSTSPFLHIDLVRPIEWKQPHKERLLKWYLKLGYREVESKDFGKLFPQYDIATPLQYYVYRKPLR